MSGPFTATLQLAGPFEYETEPVVIEGRQVEDTSDEETVVTSELPADDAVESTTDTAAALPAEQQTEQVKRESNRYGRLLAVGGIIGLAAVVLAVTSRKKKVAN